MIGNTQLDVGVNNWNCNIDLNNASTVLIDSHRSAF